MRVEEGDNKNEKTKQAWSEPQFSLKTFDYEQLDYLKRQQSRQQIPIMNECIKNQQTKNKFFASGQKLAKKN